MGTPKETPQMGLFFLSKVSSVNILLEICAFCKVKTKWKQIFYGKYISQVNMKGQGDRQAFPFNRKESIGIG